MINPKVIVSAKHRNAHKHTRSHVHVVDFCFYMIFGNYEETSIARTAVEESEAVAAAATVADESTGKSPKEVVDAEGARTFRKTFAEAKVGELSTVRETSAVARAEVSISPPVEPLGEAAGDAPEVGRLGRELLGRDEADVRVLETVREASVLWSLTRGQRG
jgi:hypothetical protein